MLFYDNVVAQRQAETGPFARRFCRKKWIEDLGSHRFRNAGAVIVYPDLELDSEPPGWSPTMSARSRIAAILRALAHCVKAVGEQVQKHPRQLLRIDLDFADSGIGSRRNVTLKSACSARAP